MYVVSSVQGREDMMWKGGKDLASPCGAEVRSRELKYEGLCKRNEGGKEMVEIGWLWKLE